MSNENKIRILYVQPGKYPEERSRIPVVKGQCGACLQRFGQGGRSAAEPLH